MGRPVLIIEDDADIAEGLKYNLEREGLSTIIAATGEQGLVEALNTRGEFRAVVVVHTAVAVKPT